MGAKSEIAWTDATWNATTGCTRVSPGCDGCYAFALHDQRHVAWKRGRMPNAPAQYHQPFSQVQAFEDRLELPLHWRKPRRIFVDSMADLFHEDVPDEFIDRVFAVMALTPQHTYQVLTKRPERMRAWSERPEIADLVFEAGTSWRMGRFANTSWPLPNCWLGVSVEDQQRADERIPLLLQTPAAVRFISAEPLLGPIDLRDWPLPKFADDDPRHTMPGRCSLSWVIVGGESGARRRDMDLGWARNLRDQCTASGVPFFFKQGSARRPGMGRELDGREWSEFPQPATAQQAGAAEGDK